MTGERPAAPAFEAALLAQGYTVAPPEVTDEPEWDDEDEFGLDDSDAPILEEALAERTYRREGEALPSREPAASPRPAPPPPRRSLSQPTAEASSAPPRGSMARSGPSPSATPSPSVTPSPPAPPSPPASRSPLGSPSPPASTARRPPTLLEDRPPGPPTDLADRLRAIARMVPPRGPA